MAKLPSGYTQLQWIQSTGTQHIDTGITGSCRIKTKAKYTSLTTSSAVLFDLSQSSGAGTWFGGTANGKWGCGTVSGSETTIPVTTKAELDITFEGSTGVTAIVNNETVSREIVGYPFETLFIFSSSTGRYPSNTQLEIVEVYQDNSLVQHLIPAKRKSDGVVGMYDTVTSTFFTNAGTGTFTAGPEIIPPKVIIHGSVGTKKAIAPYSSYEWLEYIESTGTQYIDTNYYFTSDNSQIIADLVITSNSENQTPFGNEEFTTAAHVVGSRYFSNILHGKNGSFKAYVGDAGRGSVAVGINERHTINLSTIDTPSKNYTLQLDGTTVASGAYTGSIMTHDNGHSSAPDIGEIYIFSNHRDGNVFQQIGGMKLYSFIMYDNGEKVRDFIPARRKSDGVVGMYDKVNDVFYTNSGTGNFIAGPIKVPLKDKTELEALYFIDLDIEAITNELNSKPIEYLNFIRGGTPEGLYYEDYICYGDDWRNVGGCYILYNRLGEWTFE